MEVFKAQTGELAISVDEFVKVRSFDSSSSEKIGRVLLKSVSPLSAIDKTAPLLPDKNRHLPDSTADRLVTSSPIKPSGTGTT